MFWFKKKQKPPKPPKPVEKTYWLDSQQTRQAAVLRDKLNACEGQQHYVALFDLWFYLRSCLPEEVRKFAATLEDDNALCWGLTVTFPAKVEDTVKP